MENKIRSEEEILLSKFSDDAQWFLNRPNQDPFKQKIISAITDYHAQFNTEAPGITIPELRKVAEDYANAQWDGPEYEQERKYAKKDFLEGAEYVLFKKVNNRQRFALIDEQAEEQQRHISVNDFELKNNTAYDSYHYRGFMDCFKWIKEQFSKK